MSGFLALQVIVIILSLESKVTRLEELSEEDADQLVSKDGESDNEA
jgi:hypothetical protein